MRRRLLFSTLAVAVTAVLLFGVPLAFVLRQLQVTVAQDQVQRDATTLAKTLQNRVRSGIPASLTDAEDAARSLPDRYVSITQNGSVIYSTGTLPPHGSAIIGRAMTRNFRVTVEADKAVSNERGKLALVISLAGLAMAVAVALAIIQARRLTRPLQELAEAAGRLGSGEAGPLGRRYGIPELDQVAEGLDGSAERISELLAAEREFAADASHQLRTPLTALSMRGWRRSSRPPTSPRWCTRRARPRCCRRSGSPTWSASCSAVPTGRRGGDWPRYPSTTWWPSRWSSGIRRSGAGTASSRYPVRRT